SYVEFFSSYVEFSMSHFSIRRADKGTSQKETKGIDLLRNVLWRDEFSWEGRLLDGRCWREVQKLFDVQWGKGSFVVDF
ncbi:MAG: hypothetical protein Q4D66_06710, partial [Bacteroidales bacterium]|nr:hypothetical protein [Bacteroidales bacterium]